MDFLNRAFAQFNELFRSMPIGTRITATLLLAVVVVSIGYLFVSQSAGPDSYLLGGQPFSAAELPLVQGALAQAGLNDFEVEGNLIRIPRSKQATYIAALADANVLPVDTSSKLMQVVEGVSPFTSRDQQRQMVKHARDMLLAKSISEMRGVKRTQVFTDSKESNGLHREEIHTATVNVRMIGGQPLDTRQAQAIRTMVAGAIAGLCARTLRLLIAEPDALFPATELAAAEAGSMTPTFLESTSTSKNSRPTSSSCSPMCPAWR